MKISFYTFIASLVFILSFASYCVNSANAETLVITSKKISGKQH